MKASRNKIKKIALALDYGFRSQGLATRTLANLYNARIVALGEVQSVNITDMVGSVPEVRLVDFVPEHGNVTPLELLCLSMMVRAFKPSEVLELGTFNGNTTLQIAANLEHGSHISTLDLPVGAKPVGANDEHDAVLIHAASRERPRYVDSPYADSVRQFYGNSLEVDFGSLNPTNPGLIFIDAGHSDECVRNDTMKSLKVLAKRGCVVWHDYTQDWPDVFNYLNELAKQLPLKHIRGTNLVIYRDVT